MHEKFTTHILPLILPLVVGVAASCADLDEIEDEDMLTAEDQLPPENDGEVFRASCSGNGCNGIDPSTTACPNDAFTAQTRSIYRNTDNKYIGYVELRWSPTCKTNWARVTRTDGYYLEGMDAMVTRYGGTPVQQFSSHAGYTTIWSNMVYAPSPYCAQAFGLIDQSFTSGSAYTNCL
jgi:hypothetical protein